MLARQLDPVVGVFNKGKASVKTEVKKAKTTSKRLHFSSAGVIDGV